MTNLLDDASYRSVVRALSAQGKLGQKSGVGLYRYEGRQAIESPETAELARDLAAQHGVTRRDHIPPEEILQRLLYPLINEGFEVLREGIAASSADIDTVFAAGFGFPTGPWRPDAYGPRDWPPQDRRSATDVWAKTWQPLRLLDAVSVDD